MYIIYPFPFQMHAICANWAVHCSSLVSRVSMLALARIWWTRGTRRIASLIPHSATYVTLSWMTFHSECNDIYCVFMCNFNTIYVFNFDVGKWNWVKMLSGPLVLTKKKTKKANVGWAVTATPTWLLAMAESTWHAIRWVQWVLWALRKQCVCLRNNTCNVIVKWYDNNNGFGCLCPLSVGRPDGWSFSNGFLQFLLLQDAAHAKQGATTRKTIDLWSWFCSLFSYLNHPECKTGDGPPFGVPFNVQRLDFECEVTATVSIQ